MELHSISCEDYFSAVRESCYQYVNVWASASDLIKILGECPRQEEFEKSQFNWCVRLDAGIDKHFFAMVYDWKVYYKFSLDEKIDWHIGAASREDALEIAKVLRQSKF